MALRLLRMFGLEAQSGSMSEIASEAMRLISLRGKVCMSLNARSVVQSQSDRDLQKMMLVSDLTILDGQSAVIAARLLHGVKEPRVAGIDLMLDLLAKCKELKLRVYLLGAAESTVIAVKIQLEDEGIDIVGYHNGFWSDSEEDSLVEQIAQTSPDLLLLGFPSPNKERFATSNRDRLNAGLILCVGGSFDVLAGVTSRAPRLIQKLGLEWMYRWIQEPIRLFSRYWIGNFKFALILAREYLGRSRV